MPSPKIFCPGGTNSQSGTAVAERYPNVPIESCGKIPAVLSMLDSNDGPFVIPVWNSHEGEVKAASYVWDSIQDSKIKITDAWAKGIEFWLVRRSGPQTSHGKIGSVVVAATQCSGFFERGKSVLEKCELTTIAFDKYREGAAWDGVLVAPGQGANEPGYEVVSKQTANPNNFTSFVRFVPSRAFSPNDGNTRSWLTGVRMPTFGASLGEVEQEFFDQLLEPVKDLKDLPKLIFVFNREARVGLLFEGTVLRAGDLLDAEQLERGDISVYEDAGILANLYTNELNALFTRYFPALTQKDFVRHCGVNTCLLACPPLGLYTHGYKLETVEPVVRYYISKLFELWNDEVLKNCTPEQMAFFERHKESWLEKRSEFIQFTTVSATGM
jgi:prephenate dehydratase